MAARFEVLFHTRGDGLAVFDARDLDIEFHDGALVAQNGRGPVFRAAVDSIVTVELRRPRWWHRFVG